MVQVVLVYNVIVPSKVQAKELRWLWDTSEAVLLRLMEEAGCVGQLLF
jgi:hypothetical protein